MPTTRCPNGTRKNKKTGDCEPTTKTKSSPKKENKKVSSVKNITARCPKGTRKNKKTGNCESTTKTKSTPKISKIKQQQNIHFNKIQKDLTNIKSNYFSKKSGYDHFKTDMKNLIKDYTEAHKNNKINDQQFQVLEMDTTITIWNVNDIINEARKVSEY